MKKMVIGIIIMIVIGCVFAAGCTSSTSSTYNSDNKIIGTWTDNKTEYDSDIQQTFLFRPGGLGVEYQQSNGEYILTKIFSWKKFENSDGVRYDVSYNNGEGTNSFTYNSRHDTLTSSLGGTFSRIQDAVLDSIVGTWVLSSIYMGEPLTLYMVFKWDNTGLDVERLMGGDTLTYPFTWKKEGDLYKIEYNDGDKGTIVLDVENSTITYTDDAGKLETTIYKDLDSTGMNPIIGTWVGSNDLGETPLSYVIRYKADKTGSEFDIEPSGNKMKYIFYWEEEEGNKYTVKFNDGDVYKVTYDPEKDTITYEDGSVMTRKE